MSGQGSESSERCFDFIFSLFVIIRPAQADFPIPTGNTGSDADTVSLYNIVHVSKMESERHNGECINTIVMPDICLGFYLYEPNIYIVSACHQSTPG